MKKYISTFIALAMGMTLTACSPSNSSQATNDGSYSSQIFAMDTVMTITTYGNEAKEASDAASDEINRLDAMLSSENTESEIYALNKSGQGTLSDEGDFLLSKSLELYEATDGAFNIAIYPIEKLWGFYDDDCHVPDENDLKTTLSLAKPEEISVDSSTGEISFGLDGMAIDFGGIAKGYTSSRLMDIFAEYDIDGAIVSLGGNIQAMGEKSDNTAWKIAIQDPDDPSDYIGYLTTEATAVVTSGGYERYFEEDGTVYHHILDPATGYPANNGIKSASIVSSDGTLADGLSTSVYIMGLEKASDFWKNSGYDFGMILLTDDDELYVTSDIAGDFTSDLDIHLIDK